ncbi:hypothetical protein IFM46972_02725 [Aspergillus udagawae]|uniref:Uncharacterized protein n=1 Tax=Aspergillus udagawae TaxID=91492 RepID=A0A8H3NBI0_9EURO|nr:hypothetical protein IFM46972_02725 [Aspergillus udagawae]
MSASPHSQTSAEDEDTITIPIDRSFSDGDPSTWPTEPRFGMPDDTWYREKLAIMWLKDTGAYEEVPCCLLLALQEYLSEYSEDSMLAS